MSDLNMLLGPGDGTHLQSELLGIELLHIVAFCEDILSPAISLRYNYEYWDEWSMLPAPCMQPPVASLEFI